jgi:hypothetical protein
MHAICRRNRAELDPCSDRFGVKARYTSYEDLLKDPNVDAVHINSPIGDHAPQSIAALKAGHGRVAAVLGGVPAHALRDALRQPVPALVGKTIEGNIRLIPLAKYGRQRCTRRPMAW